MMAKEVVYNHNLPYDPTTLKAGETLLEQFPTLATYGPLLDHGFGDKDKYLRYCVFLSSGSGLHRAIPEWPKRKAEALRLAGIAPDDARAAAILSGEDEQTTEMRWCWMRTFCPMEYAEYVALIERYYQNLAKVERPIKEDSEAKDADVGRAYNLCDQLAENLPTLRAAIKALEKDLFMGDAEMKRLATERAKPQAETGSIEEKVMKRNQK